MGDVGDTFRVMRAKQKENKARYKEVWTKKIEGLRRFGFDIQEFTPTHFRVAGFLDIFPVNRRYHDIRKNERGKYESLAPFIIEYLRHESGRS